jgi:hypothetical protein
MAVKEISSKRKQVPAAGPWASINSRVVELEQKQMATETKIASMDHMQIQVCRDIALFNDRLNAEMADIRARVMALNGAVDIEGMDKKLLSELTESMTQMGEIVRGERAPSREFHVADAVNKIKVAYESAISNTDAWVDCQVGLLAALEEYHSRTGLTIKTLIFNKRPGIPVRIEPTFGIWDAPE